MINQKTLVILVLIMGLGLVTVVAIDAILSMQEAEAGCERGPAVNRSFERSSGKCFDRGTF
jgi:hypothetical protein